METKSIIDRDAMPASGEGGNPSDIVPDGSQRAIARKPRATNVVSDQDTPLSWWSTM